MERSTADIKFREDLYPRFEPDQATIEKYSNSIEFLPPIKIDQNNILIDGYHRLKAHQRKKIQKIKIEIVKVESEKELKKLAYKYNSHHGLQLSNEEKRKFSVEMVGEMSIKDLSEILSVSQSSIEKWTAGKREALKDERDRQIVDSYLKAENTQQVLSKKFNVPQQTIADVIKNTEKRKITEIGKDFNPLIYNIWNTPKGKTTEHFGAFPPVFMDNLLYYHTKPLDIVYDPFTGSGTTVESCKRMFRRYYCSDRIVKPGMESNVKKWEIKNGLPEDLPKPDIVFLDPPYWKQAENKYSEDKNDLANVSLQQFNKLMESFLSELKKRKVEKIAIVIQPTEYVNDLKFVDHIFDFHSMLDNKYRILKRYVLPYSSEQYTPQSVEKAKKQMVALTLNRDLVVWKLI